jgi:arsenate reductase
VFSAGTEKTSVHPLVVEAMCEVGIDINSHRSKTVEEFIQRRLQFAGIQAMVLPIRVLE